MNISSLLNYLITSFLILNAGVVNKNNSNQQNLVNNIVTEEYCASHTIMEQALLSNPDLLEKTNQLELDWETYASSQSNQENLTPPNYLLPVVFHIIHDNGSENISDALVLQSLQDMNDAFANTGYYDQGTGVDTEIQFCLAKRDPDGNPTTGINRVVSPLTEFSIETQDIDMKDLSRWDPTNYINIWLVREICSISVGCGVAGYAYFPSSHGNPEDGIVLEAQFAGSSPANSAALAHEMGHYLGLYHTFQGGCTNNNCLVDGDRVCDTPPDQSTVPAPCTIDINSCTTDVNPSDPNNPFTTDQNDMFWNYMDYGDWNCYSAFTIGQDERMDFFIEGARVSLLDSEACIDACPNPIFIAVTPCDTLIEIGADVTFVNTTTGATNFEWTVNNVLESTTTDFTFNFGTEGTYSVLLTAFNGDTNCIVSKELVVIATDCTGSAHVSDGAGSDVPTCGAPGTPCQTIQYALDNIICSGDTVFIYSGTYQLPAGQPNTVPIAKIPENYSVTFFGIEDNGPILIDGNNAHRAFQYNYYGSNCPDGDPDDGIDVSNVINFAHLTIQNVYLQAYSCATTNQVVGGGIQIFNSPGSDLSVSVRDCIFEDNFLEDPVSLNNSGRSVSGAAVYVHGFVNAQNAATTSATVVIDSCSFSNNRCHQLDNGGHGGAVCVIVCDSTSITNSTFCNNNTFSENSDSGDLLHDRNAGGAILFHDNYNQFPGHEYSIFNCSFIGNSATTQDGASFDDQSEGGAVFLTRGDVLTATTNAVLTIGNSQFYDNTIETGIEHVDNNSGTLDLISTGANVFADDLEFDLGPDTSLCSGATLFAPVYIAGATYEWSTGETGPVIEVSSTGTYAVTVTAGQCVYSDEILIVVENCSVDCENTYFETIGTVDQDEGGMGMIPSGDGNFYVKGYQGDRILIIKMQPDGTVIWTRTLKVTNEVQERLHDMILDSDGYLVGSGNGGATNDDFEGFVFKYDPNADVLIWSSQVNSEVRTSTILEPSPTDNYRVTGLSWGNNFPGQAEDGYILSIDRNTGALSGEVATSYNTGDTDGLLSSTIYNGFIYATGVYNQGTGMQNFRGFVSKFDLLGNEQWSRSYIQPLSATARMYGSDIEIDQDSIVVTYYGDDNGTSFLTDKIYLTKTDIDGNLAWANSYTYPGFSETFVQELVVISDGYLVTTYNRASPGQIALMKIDKSGNIIWAKAYSSSGDETMDIPAVKDQTIVVGDRIYVVGKTTASGSSDGDVLVMKVDMEGNLQEGCPFVSDLDVERTPYTNPFEGTVNVEAYNNSLSISSPTATLDTDNLVTAQSCLESCEENCEDTYFKTIGNVDQDEGGMGIIPSGDGNFYLKGYQGDNVLLNKITVDGDVIWSRSMKFTDLPNERLFDLMLDSEGYLVGCGTSGLNSNTHEGFVFKYDPNNDNLLWASKLGTQVRMNKVLETSSLDNYRIIGVKWSSPSPGNMVDVNILSVDRNTGALTAEVEKAYTSTGTTDFYSNAIVIDGSIYASGAYTPGSTFSTTRGAITKFDFAGNIEWARIHQAPLSSTARLTTPSLINDQDSLVTISFGDADGTNGLTDQIFLSKSDLDGNQVWSKSYELPDYSAVYSNRLIATSDGYLLLARSNAPVEELALLKVDKNGNFQWAKGFAIDGSITLDREFTSGLIYLENDRIYITGRLQETGSSTGDILLIKTDLDGNLLSPCPFVLDLDVNESTLPPFSQEVAITEYNSPINLSTATSTIDSVSLTTATSCLGPCAESEICDNGIDDDGDGLIDCYDPDCCESELCDGYYYNDCITSCEYDPVPGDFELEEEWSTLGNGQDWCSYNTPITGDLDGDGIPEVIGKPCTGISAPSGLPYPNLLIVDGSTGLIEATINTPAFYYLNDGPAIADVDNNGYAEIFIQASDDFSNASYAGGVIINGDVRRRVLCYEFDGTTYVEKWMSSVTGGYGAVQQGLAVSVTDFNGDGLPEVYVGNQIFNGLTGDLLVSGGVNNHQGFRANGDFATQAAAYTVAADVLPDNACPNCDGLELVAGGMVYSVVLDAFNPGNNQMTVEVELTDAQDGWASIADIDNDGDLDAVITTHIGFNGVVYIWDLQTPTELATPWSVATPDGFISQANIADFDGDGVPEMGVCTQFSYQVLEISGTTITDLWAITTDDWSGSTGSTVFDFNSDGANEVVYRAEGSLFVLDGSTGAELASVPCQSGTRIEYPVVVDVDADGETEILCSCASELKALGSANLPWVDTRSVWNQHNYFNVNIEDDMTVPTTQQEHHIVGDSIVMNNFLVQYADPNFPVPDATISAGEVTCNDDSLQVTLTICNIGENVLTNETPVTFYDGNPTTSAATALITLSLDTNIPVDSCLMQTFVIPELYESPIYIVVNDDASLVGPFDLENDFPVTSIAECDYTNNIDSIMLDSMPPDLDLGPDTTICDNGVLELNAGSGFDTYEWHDGTTDSVYVAYGAGEYWVEVTTYCGVKRDTIEIEIDEPTIISLPDTIPLCGVPCTTLTVTDWYDSYEWFPTDGLDCSTCSTVTVCPDGPVTYSVLGSSLQGCFSIDSVTIIPIEPQLTIVDTLVCLGETVVVGNVEIEIGESDTLFTTGQLGCEDTVIYNVGWNGGENIEIDVLGTACANEFFIYDGVQIPPGGTEDFIYESYLGCDSIIHVDVLGLPIYDIDIPETICNGDSMLIFGEYQTQSGTYSMTFDSENDCDSTINVILNVLPAITFNFAIQNTCTGTSDGSITVIPSGGSGSGYSYEWGNGESSETIMDLPEGNYTVTVTDGDGCTEEATASVNETDIQATTTSGDVSCNGSSDGFIEVVNPLADWTFSLNGGTPQNDPLFDNLPAGDYVLEVVDGAGCILVMNPVVNEPPQIAVDLGPDVIITIGEDYQLQAAVNIMPPYTVTWSPTNNLSCPDGEPDLNCLNPIITDLIDETEYTLTVAAIGNPDCNASATIRVTPFLDCDKVYDIPNAFTPDADGVNDYFGVIAEGLREVVSFEVYNRWGVKVFEGNGLDARWDGTIKGKPAPSDVYLYMIRVECPDREERVLSGDVTLIR